VTTALQIDSLTERQKECLRGVLALESAKQTAKRLGVSEYTVKEHLAEARSRLSVATSADAAKAFAAFDRNPLLTKGMLQEGATIPLDLGRSRLGGEAGESASSFREEHLPFDSGVTPVPHPRLVATGSRLAGHTTKDLIVWMALSAVLLVFAIVAAPAMLKSVEDLLH
jgi:DNA-binding CsgD family transcriptional regulator